jgi:hypothetical protein
MRGEESLILFDYNRSCITGTSVGQLAVSGPSRCYNPMLNHVDGELATKGRTYQPICFCEVIGAIVLVYRYDWFNFGPAHKRHPRILKKRISQMSF